MILRATAAIAGVLLLFALLIYAQTGGTAGTIYGIANMSTNDLSQWPHLDYGLGTDLGSNYSGAGYLWYHANVAGRPAAGMTVTPTAHASLAANNDSVCLEPTAHCWHHSTDVCV